MRKNNINTNADKTQENITQSVANAVTQNQSGGESILQFFDSRPGAIAQRKLQEIANNSPQVVQLMVFQGMANNSYLQLVGKGANLPVQRMVAIAQDDMSGVDDALVLNNLDYAIGHFGGPVGDFQSNRKFGETKPGDRVGIVAHGGPGKIGGYNAEAVADTLTKKPQPINKGVSSIVLYSCNAGMDQEDKGPDSSLVHGLSAALKEKEYEIGVEGQKGIGFGFKGIGERTTKGTEKEGDTNWFKTRDELLRLPKYTGWGKPGQGFVEADKLLAVARKLSPEQIANMKLEEKAAVISEIMVPFWRDVEKLMGNELYDHLKGWVRVISYIGGGELVQDSR